MNGVVLVLIFVALFASIGIAYKTKHNLGFFCFVIAYVFGCFVLNMKVNDVINTFPTSIVFMLIAVTAFSGFASQNGTMEAIAKHMMYKTRNVPWLIPWAVFVISFVLAVVAGATSVNAIMGPFVFSIAAQTGMNPLLAVVAISMGALIGGATPVSNGGVIIRGIFEGMPEYSSQATGLTFKVFLGCIVTYIIIMAVTFIIFKGYKTKNLQMEKPEPFTKVQKLNTIIFIVVICVVALPPLLNNLFPNPTFKMLSTKLDVKMVALVAALLCALLRVADSKKVVTQKIPWNTIFMVAGVSMTMGIAKAAGITDVVTNWVGGSLPKMLVPVILALVAGIMSFFSGAITVVVPLLGPMVGAIAAATGLNPAGLMMCVHIGSGCTGMSPFSTGGSMLLGCCVNEDEREKLFIKQFLYTFVPLIIVMILGGIGFFNMFG